MQLFVILSVGLLLILLAFLLKGWLRRFERRSTLLQMHSGIVKIDENATKSSFLSAKNSLLKTIRILKQEEEEVKDFESGMTGPDLSEKLIREESFQESPSPSVCMKF